MPVLEGTVMKYSEILASQMETCPDVAYQSGNSKPEDDANDIALIDRGENLVPAVWLDAIHELSKFLRYATGAYTTLHFFVHIWTLAYGHVREDSSM